jgi:hypothetical protein
VFKGFFVVMSNPYAPPNIDTELPTSVRVNGIAYAGFLTSAIGLLAMFAISPFGPMIGIVATFVAFLSLPGLILSVIGLSGQRRRLASWGVVLGLLGTMNLPTLILSLTR